jgi:signal transduction histidine kinase
MAERRRLRPGFRLRVLGFSALLLFGAAGAEMIVQRTILLARLDRRITDSLDQERTELERLAVGRDPATGEPFGDDTAAIFDTFLSRNVPAAGEVYLTFVDGEPHYRPVAPVDLGADRQLAQRWAGLTEGERGEISTEEGDVRYLAVPLGADGDVRGVFVVAHFVQAEREAIEDDIRVRAIGVAIVSSIALGAAWLTAGRLLRPLRNVTTTARRISDTDLSRRIPVEGRDEIAEMAATFNQMLDRLEAAFSSQRAFIDDAGHELRTPITVVMGQLELMGDDPEDQARTLAIVDDELSRMARIVEDLLLLAKAEQRDFVRPGPVELADLTTELLVKARTLGDRRWQLDACAEGTVELDGQRLTQAVLNLARNAVEHTVAGTPVWIGSERSGGRVRVWVRDAGGGIPEDDQHRIFERFARGRGRRSSAGAGLGLAIVSAIARGHGGQVTLVSAPGEGATFTIDLPDTTPPEPAPDAPDGGADPTMPSPAPPTMPDDPTVPIDLRGD